MKKFIFSAFFLGFISASAQTYCVPEFDSGCDDGDQIDSFSIPAAQFSDMNTGCSTTSYEDFTAKTITVSASSTYDYSVEHLYDTQYVMIWADFNNDGTFDTSGSELLSSAFSDFSNTNNGAFTIPASIPVGSYRLRIATRFNNNPLPCNTIGYGEAHDYTLVVTPAPTCSPPTNFIATNTTSDSVNISWTGPAGSNQGYEYYIALSTAAAPNSTTTPTGAFAANSTSGVISQLNTATAYRVWMRTICSSTDKSAWSVYKQFSTMCSAANVPYTEGFESVTAPAIPICVALENAGSGNNWMVANDYDWTGNFANTMVYEYNEDYDANAWFYTQGLNLTAGTQYSLTYTYQGNGYYEEKMKVAYGTSASSTTMTNILADYPSIMSDLPETVTVTFTPPTTGVYYIGFNCYSDADMASLIVDDINVQSSNLATNETLASKNGIKIHPNPFSDVLNISDVEKVKTIAVMDTSGKIVRSFDKATPSINLSGLNSGMYLVVLTMKDGSKQTIKAIKK